jgi:hypothetical protein
MRIVPAHGWFTGFRKFVAHRITLFVSGLLITTLVLAIADDRQRQHQVANVLGQLVSMRPGEVDANDVIAFARKNGFVPISVSVGMYKEAGCDDNGCDFRRTIEADPLISWVSIWGSEYTGIKARWFERFGVKPWIVTFKIKLRKQHLTSSGVQFRTARSIPKNPYGGWTWNDVSVAYTNQLPGEMFQSEIHENKDALSRRPNYLAWVRRNLFLVVAGRNATENERTTALSFDLSCLSKNPCPRWGDIVPNAWRDFCSQLLPEPNLYNRECAHE